MDVNTSEPKNNDTCFGNVKEVRFDQAKVAQLKRGLKRRYCADSSFCRLDSSFCRLFIVVLTSVDFQKYVFLRI